MTDTRSQGVEGARDSRTTRRSGGARGQPGAYWQDSLSFRQTTISFENTAVANKDCDGDDGGQFENGVRVQRGDRHVDNPVTSLGVGVVGSEH